MSGWLVVWVALACGGGGARAAGWLGAPAAFDVESAVLLNDVARSHADVGYRLRAALSVAPLWAQPPEHFLLKFTLHSPKLYLKGKHVHADFMPYESVWDKYTDSVFYGHWSKGLITEAYLDPDELPDVISYKKALLSLFQFQALEGRYNETDVSGPCNVLYETMSQQVFRKIKMECESDGDGVVRSARRVARYTLSDAGGALRELHAEEVLALGHAALGLKARSWHRLQARALLAPAAPPHPELAAARRALGAATPHSLQLPPSAPPASQEQERELEAALLEEEQSGALRGEGAGEGGAGAHAAAAARLLPLLRAAPPPALPRLLRHPRLQDDLPGLCRLLGLAGTRAAHAAAADFLQLASRDPLRDLAHVYLDAFALAAAPDDAAVLELLRLGEEGRAPDVAESALLAAAAAAARAPPALAQSVRDALARSLPRCKDDECRALRLRALANLRAADGADLLLEHAERASGAAALAALDALGAAPASALTFARLDRLAALALDERAPLELRAAALDLVVRRRASLPAPLAGLARALHARGPHELRRVLWQRMAALAPAHEPLRALPAMLEPELRGWNAQAHAGTSAVLARDAGWALGGWRSSLESLQVARDGLLRRGSVLLLAEDTNNRTYDVLAVEVWTRGLQAFGGGEQEAEPAEEPEEPAAGLALAVGGVRLRELTLFRGQAALLAHVWAGTASAPTPVLRALLPLAPERADVPLLGGVRLRAEAGAALALALDAAAQASLWRRSARAELRLRGGLAAGVRAELAPAWGRLEASARVRAEPRLRVSADLDFYSGVALCVRARTERVQWERGVWLQSAAGARRLRVRRERVERSPAEGRTLSLGRGNDVTCRTLLEADDPADAD